jgi:MFS family permease
MTRIRRGVGRTFAALAVRNYRLYFIGQTISVSGTWMQGLAQAWLVLKLTGSGVTLGTVTAVQFAPILVAGPWGGVVADRLDKRRLLFATQITALVLALTLGVLVATDAVRLWMVYVLALGLGCVTALDNPARQTFVLEMVGPDRLANAVSLNSVVMNASRVVGPAIGGVLIATVGIASCFLINAGSYVAVLVALAMMRTAELHGADRPAPARGQLREGLAYVARTPALRTPLLVMAAIGTLAYEFQVTLPLLAKFTFGAGAGGYGAMSSVLGAGSVIGGLATASLGKPTSRRLTGAAVLFGVLILVTAATPSMALALVALPVMGAVSINFIAMANSTLQLTAPAHMRGRVMALYAVAFLGSTPVGAPIVGWVAELGGPRAALVLGGLTAIAAGALGRRSLVRGERDEAARPELPLEDGTRLSPAPAA